VGLAGVPKCTVAPVKGDLLSACGRFNRKSEDIMALPTFSMSQLIQAGVHFGHNTRRWNPKMAPFLFGARDNIHIIDLQQSVPMLYRAMQVVSAGGCRWRARVVRRHQASGGGGRSPKRPGTRPSTTSTPAGSAAC